MATSNSPDVAPDPEPTSGIDALRQQSGLPDQQSSAWVYTSLGLPDPYYSPDERRGRASSKKSFTLFGEFRPAEHETILEHVISCFRKEHGQRLPYTFTEFCRLIDLGSLLPSPPDKNNGRLYASDPVLANLPEDSPLHTLRKAFIYREAARTYQEHRQYEKLLLKRALEARGAPENRYQAYLAYLSSDHPEIVAHFFREWRLPVTEFDRERHTLITAKTGYGKSELIKLAIYSDISLYHLTGYAHG